MGKMTPEQILELPIFRLIDQMIMKSETMVQGHDTIVMHPLDYEKFLGGVIGEITYKGWRIKTSALAQIGACYTVNYDAFFKLIKIYDNPLVKK
jgi:hypothetical protein